MSTRAAKTKERLPPELEMVWPNYLFPVLISSALMCACWAVGHFAWSFLWIVLFTVLYVLKTHTWIRREQHRTSMRSMIMREREMVMAQYSRVDDLPAWVRFPDIERIEWVNKIIQQIWPHIGEYTKVFLKEFIEPQVRAQMPSPFKSFKFVAVDMGDIPFRVGGLKVYTQNVGRDRVIMDMDVVYAGDAEFAVQVCGFRGGLNQMVFSGKLRCTLQPLLSQPPMVGGVSSSFMELPKFDFNLTGMGEFVQLPGLIDAIRSVVNTQVANLLVLPNKIVVPLAPNVDVAKLYFPEPDGIVANLLVLPNKIVVPLAPNVDVAKLYFPEPDGIVRMKIIEAMNLENKDGSFLNKRDISDPYCEIQVGSQVFHTRVINNNLNPVFNECFEAVVDQASGQKLRIELFDKDTAGADEELGRLSIPLESVRQAGEMERWHHLEGCKHGDCI
uniref:C2 domain-containing protein n=1 Tax=Globodera pallida TaxID=36090 RepID=A0A183BMV6_GLOPA